MAYISSITHTKEFLQNFKRDQDAFRATNGVVQSVLRSAAQGQTRHVQRLDDYGPLSNFNERLVHFLKQFFPDSLVEYREVARLNGTLERGIVIDWS